MALCVSIAISKGVNMQSIKYRTYISSWDISDILWSSAELGGYIGGLAALLSLTFGDIIVMRTLRIFALLFVGGFLFALCFQFLGPVIYRVSRNLSGQTEKTIAAVIASVVAIGAMTGVYRGWVSIQQSRIAPYAAYLDEYLAQPAARVDQGKEKIVGKIMTVNLATQQIDDFYLKLPKSYQPTSAEEVGTILQLTYGEADVRKLSNGGKAYKVTCEITLIDLTQNAIIARKTFIGDRPVVPSHGAAGSSFAGPAPDDQIIEFIESLRHEEYPAD